MTARHAFLLIDDVLLIHALAIEDQGGDPGIRDAGLLESALAQPAQSFGGVSIHSTIQEVAAAYLFYLARNHPFIDGNKRAGYGAMIAFLAMNGLSLRASTEEAVSLVLGVASGQTGRDEIVDWLSDRIVPRESSRS